MSNSLAIQTVLYYKTTVCITCGCHIALENEFYDRRLQDRRDFYCPNGHSQHFVAETEAERLKKQLAEREAQLTRERARTSELNTAITKAKRATARLKTRIQNGVCPCCHRTVKQLAAHMASKHPDYSNDGSRI